MLQLDIAGIAHAIGGHLIGNGERQIRGVVTDSRRVRPGDLFVALDGARTDGHKFLEQVLKAGAAAALVMPDRGERPPGLACVVVGDTLQALAALARFHLGRLNCQVVGITGTVGKTTAKDFLAHLLGGPLCRVHAAPASYNSECGLPLAVLGAPLDSQFLVLEYGVNAPGEMARLLSIAQPHFSWITALTPVHLEGMRNMATIVEEKLLLAAATRETGQVWMTAEVASQSEGMEAQWLARSEIISMQSGGETQPRILRAQPGAYELDLPTLGVISLPLEATHEATQVAIAARMALAFGVPPAELTQRLCNLPRPDGRMTRHTFGSVRVMDDSYNASPAAAEAALRVLASWPSAHRRIAVMGSMHELGVEAERWHVRLGEYVAEAGVEILIAVGSGGDWIAKRPRQAGMECWVVDDAEAAAKILSKFLQPNDLILLKASRAEKLETILPYIRVAADQLDPHSISEPVGEGA